MPHPINLTEQNVAINGYDPVSYFVAHPVPGSSDITSTTVMQPTTSPPPKTRPHSKLILKLIFLNTADSVLLQFQKVNLFPLIQKPIK